MPHLQPSQEWRRFSPDELERQYDARASVPSFDAEYARYVAACPAVLADARRREGLVYDTRSGEKLDLYHAGPDSPVFVWIHGGYWRALSRLDNAFAAAGPLAHGISVAVIDYTLAPAASLDEIVRQVRSAIGWLAAHGAGLGLDVSRIHVGGSSAGGQLAGMLLAQGWQQPLGVDEDIMGAVLTLSGLFDLEPLLGTKVNGWMGMDGAAAQANSPIRLIPDQSSAHLIASVGGHETDEFSRQSRDFAAAFAGAGHATETVPMVDFNHFDIALDLAQPQGPLVGALVAAIGRYHPNHATNSAS